MRAKRGKQHQQARWQGASGLPVLAMLAIVGGCLLPAVCRGAAASAPAMSRDSSSHLVARSPAQKIESSSPVSASPETSVTPAGPYENQLIPRGPHETDGVSGGAGGHASGETGASGNSFPAGQLLLAMGIVLLAIWLLQRFGRRLFSGMRGARSSRAIRIVARSAISPRQHLLLIRVGRRLVLASNSGTQMNALCEIEDADEVAALLGQVDGESEPLARKTFGSLFQAAREKFDASAGHLPSAPLERKVDEEIGSGENASNDSTDGEPTEPSGGVIDVWSADEAALPNAETLPDRPAGRAVEPDAASVASMRQELSGLSSRIRQISRQFQQS